MILSAIVAVSENGVIGRDNDLPWRIPEDLKHFKKVTSGHPIIMGRKTFESLGRPLPQRENIVITRNPEFQFPGVQVFGDLQSALEYCRKKLLDQDEAFIIGGAEIYQQAMPFIQKLYLTKVHQQVDGDRYFPEIDFEQDFKILHEEAREQTEPQPLKFTFIEAIKNET